MKRCSWVPAHDELYIRYHDEEWGVPEYDDGRLFEMLCLEGAQAGLSWRTILQKREGYRALFAGFHIPTLARYSDARLTRIVSDPRIVRNRQKVWAIRENARAYARLLRDRASLSEFLWDFVGGRPRRNRWATTEQIPTITTEAEAMSKALKSRGFKFVGPTTCYAFMQAVGMVNDHLTSCGRHAEIAKLQQRS